MTRCSMYSYLNHGTAKEDTMITAGAQTKVMKYPSPITPQILSVKCDAQQTDGKEGNTGTDVHPHEVGTVAGSPFFEVGYGSHID